MRQNESDKIIELQREIRRLKAGELATEAQGRGACGHILGGDGGYARNRALEQEVETLRTANATLLQERQALGRSSEKSEKRRSGEVALLQRQLAASNTEAQAAQSAARTLEQELSETRERLDTVVQRLTAELATERSARSNDERRAEDLSRRLAPLERQLCVGEVEVDSLRADVARAHNEAAASKLHAQVQQTTCMRRAFISFLHLPRMACSMWQVACSVNKFGAIHFLSRFQGTQL